MAVRLAAIAFAVLFFSGCRVDGRVDVAVDAGGGGQVTVDVFLDRDAVAELGDLTAQLRIADLQATGWEVDGPVEVGDGAWQVRAEKPFATVGQGERVLAEVAPALAGIGLQRRRSLLRTAIDVRGAIDLTAGAAAFSDKELTDQLGGMPFGVDMAELERRLGSPVADAVGLEVVVRLPGDDAATTWRPRLGERLVVDVSGERLNRVNITFALVAFLCAAAFVATFRRG